MCYTFRVVFSGPCAYVPNAVEAAAGKAKSWSVILPELRRGWPGDRDGIRVDRHLPVLRYSPDDFDSSEPFPDASVRVKDRSEFSLIYLKGHRITFNLPGAADLKVEDVVIPPAISGVQAEVKKLMERRSPLLRSTDWLPRMSWLLKELEFFGRHDPAQYFRDEGEDDDGYPVADRVAGHVILKQGTLITNEIDKIQTRDRGEQPTIWEFMPLNATKGSGFRSQALAKSVALEVEMSDQPASITIAFSNAAQTILSLKPGKLIGTPTIEIEIMNRELEEVFQVKDFEVEVPQIDLDFRYLYSHAAHYNGEYTEYPLPHLLEAGDPGNEAGTCGGNQFSGFASGFEAHIERWQAQEEESWD